MHTAIGVFSARDRAATAFQELLERKVPQEEIVFLSRAESEEATSAKEVGATIFGFMGFTAGMTAGVGTAMLLVVPGIGQVFALGFGAAALLGLAGAGAGSAIAKTTKDVVPATPDEKCSDDVEFFREVLAEGRSLIVVRTETDETANLANEVLNRLGIVMQEHIPVKLQTARRQVADVVIVDVSGRITVGEGSVELREIVRELAQNGCKKILLNLHHVGYIDSSGLGELVKAYSTVSNQGGQLKLVDVSKRVDDLLRMTKLHLVLDIQSDEASAIQSFGKATASQSLG